MNSKRFLLSATAGVLIATGATAGPSAPPDSVPPATMQSRPLSRDARGNDAGRPFLGEARMRLGIQPTAEQTHAAEAFVSEHSPNHFKVYQSVSERMHNHMQGPIVQGYLELQTLEVADPELYKMKLQQIAVQDKIFGLAFHPGEGRSIDKQNLREQLRPLEREVIRLRKAEAEHRLRRLADAMEKEKSRLKLLEAADSSGVDAMVDQDLERNGPNPAIFGGPFRNGPPPGPPPTTAPSRP